MRYPLLASLLLVACGASEQPQTLSASVETCGDDWVRYDLPPGECLAAWSDGYDWREFSQRADAHYAHEAFIVHGISVNETPDFPECREVEQFGLLAKAGAETLSVSIKGPAAEVFTVDSPECASMKAGFDSF